MQQVLPMIYLWLKAGHIIFVIFWMAGLFALPRYFVYHQEAAPGSAEEAVWLDRERKLMKIILMPSLVVVWVLGLALVQTLNVWTAGWLHVKLLLVLGLTGYHMVLISYHRKLAAGQRTLTGKQLRLLNEVPGVAAALIVIMVVLRPF
jgi:protoporphyrinogen IX oxidase